MAVNLLEMVKEGLPPSFASMAGGLLGESGAATGNALGALLPAIIAGVAHKGATEGGAQSVLSMLNNPALDTSLLGRLGSIFGAGGTQANAMMNAGSMLATSIFGDKVGNLSSALASVAGLANPKSAQSLVALAVPIVLTFVKRSVASAGMTAGGLASLLGAQGTLLQGALDSRLTGALGYPDPASMLATVTGKAANATHVTADRVAAAGTPAAAATAGAEDNGRSAFARWWPWLVVAIIVLYVLSRCMNAQKAPEPAPAPSPVAAPVPAAAPAPAATAPAVPTALPAKIYFASGATTLSPDSQATVDAVAALVKADGGKVDITGYADATGDAAANAEIAKNRARAVRDALVAAGVAEANLNLAPPASFTGTGGDAEARRVEVSKAK
ncbi:MAG: DUF937 domain-containing protein [Proteobacteria bacterium]|nr:DUF937 domain-containing protein [Pseudomonadota bacterium]